MALYERTATFEYDDYPGLEVRMRLSLPVREYLDAIKLIEDNERLATEEGLHDLCALIDRQRISWTLDGDAMDQPVELLVGIALVWARAVAQAPVPLPRPSSATAASPEASTSPES